MGFLLHSAFYPRHQYHALNVPKHIQQSNVHSKSSAPRPIGTQKACNTDAVHVLHADATGQASDTQCSLREEQSVGRIFQSHLKKSLDSLLRPVAGKIAIH